jgi:opacity protein-like surface antigen
MGRIQMPRKARQFRRAGGGTASRGFFMKTLILAAAAALFLSASAQAAVMTIPSDDPVASMMLPDDWDAHETDTGMEVNSADGSVYFAVDIAEAKDTSQTIDDAAKFLDTQGVSIDTNTQKYSEEKLNGRDIIYIAWDGQDKDGPASIGLAALVLNAKTVLVLTYWGTKGDEDKNTAAIGKILNSIKSIE